MANKKTENEKTIWRDKVLPEHLYPNKEWFLSRDKPVPESIEGLNDYQLVIKLGGLKHLLKERGYKLCRTQLTHINEQHVSAACEIVFIENGVDNEVSYTANASAHINNVDNFALRYLEATAENRAFARCIRNYLNINIVSDEELTKGPLGPIQMPEKKNSFSINPLDILKDYLNKEFGITNFIAFKQTKIRELYEKGIFNVSNEEINSWKEWEHIPAKELRMLLGILKSTN